MEKTFSSYYDDDGRHKADMYLPQEVSSQRKKSQWMRKPIIFLTLIIGLLLTALAVKSPFRFIRRQNYTDSPHHGLIAMAVAEPLSLATVSQDPLSDGSAKGTDDSEFFSQDAAPKGPDTAAPSPNLSTLNPVIGVSIAASVDQDWNQHLYDLDSNGRIRVRRLAGNGTSWSSPEVIPIDPAPKANSPIAAISWKEDGSYSNLRLYYLDSTNHIVEYASSYSTAASYTWSRTAYFDATSSGGISAVYTNENGVRLYFIAENGAIEILVALNGGWETYQIGITASLNSSLSATTFTSGYGPTTGVEILFVNPEGQLKEIRWKKGTYDSKYSLGRTIDANYLSRVPGLGGAPNLASVWGVPSLISRVYHLSLYGPAERYSYTPNDEWTSSWWTLAATAPPDIPGGAVAAVGWNRIEVRVYYVSGGSFQTVQFSHGYSNWGTGVRFN